VLQVGKAAGAEQRAHQVVAGCGSGLPASMPPSRGWSGRGCSRWSGGIRRSTAGTGCRRCWRSPVAR
jgi:hypothetical protein